MEGEICLYSKYGFCKYKESCRKQNIKEVCDIIKTCRNLKCCSKRHPRVCKKFTVDNYCQFGNDCSYFHPNNTETKVSNYVLESKVEIMERNIEVMANTIINLEAKIEDLMS